MAVGLVELDGIMTIAVSIEEDVLEISSLVASDRTRVDFLKWRVDTSLEDDALAFSAAFLRAMRMRNQ